MNNLFTKEGNSIHTFKTGDIIIRLSSVIHATHFNDNLMIPVLREVEDNSFRREPVELVGIENNLIYLRSIKELFGTKTVYKVPLEKYSENWALFIIPEGLTMDDCL